jgi:hypothetical protein
MDPPVDMRIPFIAPLPDFREGIGELTSLLVGLYLNHDVLAVSI